MDKLDTFVDFDCNIVIASSKNKIDHQLSGMASLFGWWGGLFDDFLFPGKFCLKSEEIEKITKIFQKSRKRETMILT